MVLSENNSKKGMNNTEVQYIFNSRELCAMRMKAFSPPSPSLLLRPTRPPLQSPPFLIAK